MGAETTDLIDYSHLDTPPVGFYSPSSSLPFTASATDPTTDMGIFAILAVVSITATGKVTNVQLARHRGVISNSFFNVLILSKINL
jgi:hypothetical protein